MSTKILCGIALISVAVFGGCASTHGDKPSNAGAKVAETKAVTVKDIIAHHEKASYGKDGIAKHSSITIKGTLAIEQFNLEGPFERYAMAPNSNVTNLQVMGMSLSNGCHNGVCWAQQPGAGTSVLTGDAAAMQLQQSDFNQWQHMDRYYASMEIVEPPAGKESPNYKIKAVKKNGDTDYYDFSKESGLLVGAVFEGETVQGRMSVNVQLKNYKEFEGWMMPTEMVQSTPQATIKLTFNEVTFAPIAAEKFTKPN